LFVLEARAVTIKFIPKSNRKGRYVYSGKVDGVGVDGRGTYEVQYDGRTAIGLVATGADERAATETYRLTQMPGACTG